MRPTFSIKIASYKRPEYLRESIESILRQRIPFDSIEVFENASGFDESLIRELTHAGRVEFKINQERVSPNELFYSMATSVNPHDYVCFFHDDDRLHPEFLEEVVGNIAQHPDCALYASNAMVIDSFGSVKGKLLPIKELPVVMEERHELGLYLADSFLPCPGIVYRTADFIAPAELTKTYGNYWDVVFYGEVAKSGGVFLDGRALFDYRRHDGQLSNHTKWIHEDMAWQYFESLCSSDKESSKAVEKKAKARTTQRWINAWLANEVKQLPFDWNRLCITTVHKCLRNNKKALLKSSFVELNKFFRHAHSF